MAPPPLLSPAAAHVQRLLIPSTLSLPAPQGPARLGSHRRRCTRILSAAAADGEASAAVSTGKERGSPPTSVFTFQQAIQRLQEYWASIGCAVVQCSDTELGETRKLEMAAKAELAEAKKSEAATKAELCKVKKSKAAAKAELATTKAELGMKAELANALVATKAELCEARKSEEAAKAEVIATKAELASAKAKVQKTGNKYLGDFVRLHSLMMDNLGNAFDTKANQMLLGQAQAIQDRDSTRYLECLGHQMMRYGLIIPNCRVLEANL